MTDGQFIAILFSLGAFAFIVVYTIDECSGRIIKAIHGCCGRILNAMEEQSNPLSRVTKFVAKDTDVLSKRSCADCEYYLWERRDKPCCNCVDMSEFVNADE